MPGGGVNALGERCPVTSYTTVYYRPEDDLICRQGVKSPLKLNTL